MNDKPVVTKYELLTETDQAYTALEKALKPVTREQLTILQDPQGWTVKDHLAHLVAWERSVVFMLQGQPRYDGLEIDEKLYREGSFDQINAVIQDRQQNSSWERVLASFRETHKLFLDLIERLDDKELNRPCSHYLPDEPGEWDQRPAINALYANSADHFREHLDYIKALLDSDGS